MSIQNNFPAIRPSLNLDFANVKALDPRITFTRAASAVYYDGKTVAKAEENLLLRSQEFDNGSWNKTAATVSANTTTAPDGTTTADVFTATATGASGCSQSITTGAIPHTFSVFAKAGTCSWVRLFSVGGTNAVWFDLTNGVVGTVQGTTTAAIQSVGNGWYRCSVTSSVGGSTAFIRLANADASTDATNATTLELWGAQLEQRSAVTAYTPTTTQAITNYVPVLLTAASGVARFDHNPTTGESLGLLVEEQRTNLVTYSEQFDNADWVKSNSSITANTIVAPDGTLTGDKQIPANGVTGTYVAQAIASTSGVTYTYSVYVKAGELTSFRLLGESGIFGSNQAGNYDLSTGTASVVSGTPIVSMTAVGNGWYRCVLTAAATASTTGGVQQRIVLTGDGYSGIFIWGAQLEAGAFPTSYIPTVASQVTRAADAASMTGANFSSWYRADEGTFYIESVKNGNISFQQLININDGTISNQIAFGFGSGFYPLREDITANGISQASVVAISDTTTLGLTLKIAGAYRINDFAVSGNGDAVTTDTTGILPAVNQMGIGFRTVSTPFIYTGTIRRISYYPKRLSNVELQGLTTS